MERTDKSLAVDSIRDDISSVQSFVVAHYHGLTVNEVQELRSTIRSAGGSVRVVKNSLARRALDGATNGVAADLFSGPCAVGYYAGDPTVVPKIFKKFHSEHEALKVVGGVIDGTLLDAAEVAALADLPNLDALRGKLIGLISAPAQQLASLLTQPGAGIARVLNAHAQG